LKFFVLDASVALSWFVDAPVHPYAEAVRDQLAAGKARGVSPQLSTLEFGNGILVAERRKLLSQIQSDECIEKMNQLLRSSVELDTMHTPLDGLLPLSRTFQLTVYDACYLELALRRQMPLASLDKSLQAAAKMAGVKSA